MEVIQNTIMADESRLFACLDNYLVPDNVALEVEKATGVRIDNVRKRRPNWYDLKFKNTNISIFSSSGDLMLFVENPNCPEKVLRDFLRFFKVG